MERHTKRRGEVGDFGLVVRPERSTGPRTGAWDRPGQLLLNGLDSELSANAGQQVGREDADG